MTQELHEIVQSLARKGTFPPQFVPIHNFPILYYDDWRYSSLQDEPHKQFFPELIQHHPATVSSIPLHLYGYLDQNQKDTHKKLTNALVKPVLDDAAKQILAQKEDVLRLAEIANKHPFYKYNGVWSRELQNLVRGTKKNLALI